LPEIIEIPFDYTTLSLSEEDEFRTRSPGLHLTDVTKDMLLTSGIKRGGGKTLAPEDQKMLFEAGFLWERMISRNLQAQMNREIAGSSGALVRTGEYVDSSGIIATPDAIDTKNWHLEEWKATAIRSWNLDIQTDRPEWLWTTGFHCHFFGMNSVVFRIWHYQEMPHKIKQYKVTFYPGEITSNYDRIINHAKARNML
jgi:hypothetical protein